MKIIPTKTHGIVDYLYGIALILLPWIWDHSATGLDSLIPVLLGISIISISLMTDYETSLLRIIPMKTHLVIDILSGIFLSASPWIFNFKDAVYLPHVIFGLIAIITALSTQTKPADKKDNNLI